MTDEKYVKTLFSITIAQRDFLKKKAFESRQSMADIIRNYISKDMLGKEE